jgi:hypothetical protein
VNIVKRDAFLSQKQLKVRLLCKECEDGFNKFGGRYVFVNCLQRDGRFPLFSQVEAARPNFVRMRENVWYFKSSDSGIPYEHLAFFGASLVWRTWAAKGRLTGSRISLDLPADLEEGLRNFLLGKTLVIANSALAIHINERLPEPMMDLRYAFSLPQEMANRH